MYPLPVMKRMISSYYSTKQVTKKVPKPKRLRNFLVPQEGANTNDSPPAAAVSALVEFDPFRVYCCAQQK